MADYPSLPLWTDAYLADTHPDLSLEEHGCYMLLLMAAWRRPRCALPDDDAWFCRWLGVHGNKWRKLRTAVLERFFTPIDEGFGREFVQKRLRKERDFLEKQSRNQRENAKKRWAKDSDDNGLGDATAYAQSGNAPTPTPSSVSSLRSETGARPNGTAPPDSAKDLDALVYQRGRDLLGKNAGGQITRLRKIMSDGKILDLYEQARRKDDPASWISGVLRKHQPRHRRQATDVIEDLNSAGDDDS